MEREQSLWRPEREAVRLLERFREGYLASLQPYHNWVVWTMREDRRGDFKKVPFNPRTHRAASSTDPRSWDSLAVAMLAFKTGKYAGLGFVFSQNVPFTGIDFDHCVEDGILAPEIASVITELDSYAEESPSKRGWHVIVRGKLPGPNVKRPGIEFYDHARFFTVTLNHMATTPIDAKESAFLPTLYERYHRRPPKPVVIYPAKAEQPRYNDDAVLQKAMTNPEMGKLFRRYFEADQTLWRGRHAIHPSMSEAVWQLILYLKYYTYGNAEQMDRLFRRSKLYPLSKWEEPRGRSTYGRKTIQKALGMQEEDEER